MKRTLLSASVMCALFVGLLWAREIRLTTNPVAAAAQGSVDVGHDRNGNTRFKIEVRHLANPAALSPARQGYVVWIQPAGKQPENKGTLRVNEDLEGSFETTTPYQKFDLFVTAENDLRAEQPSGPEILRGSITAD